MQSRSTSGMRRSARRPELSTSWHRPPRRRTYRPYPCRDPPGTLSAVGRMDPLSTQPPTALLPHPDPGRRKPVHREGGSLRFRNGRRARHKSLRSRLLAACRRRRRGGQAARREGDVRGSVTERDDPTVVDFGVCRRRCRRWLPDSSRTVCCAVMTCPE